MESDIITTLRQTVVVPEDYDKQDILNFLAENQSFNEAFQGLNHPGYPGVEIKEISVIDEDFE